MTIPMCLMARFFSKYHGVVYGPTGKETYYNLDMSGVVRIMRDMGFSAEDYPYWVRDDGCKMLGSYIMCAANLNYFPRGTTVASSLGTCLVCDTGSFTSIEPYTVRYCNQLVRRKAYIKNPE